MIYTKMAYQYIKSIEEFYKAQTTSSDSIIIYSASWCGPCQSMKEWLNKDYSPSPCPIWIVDVEESELESICEHITGLPTVEVMKNGQKVQTWIGFKKDRMEEVLNKLVESETESDTEESESEQSEETDSESEYSESDTEDIPKGVTKL